MKYLLINSVCGIGSTGRIVQHLSEELTAQGNTCVIAYGRKKNICENLKIYKIGNKWDCLIHGIITRLFDKHGLGSKFATKKFIKWMEQYNPDIIHLHNIHGYYLNYEMLFTWIKAHPQKQVIWTLHDCWTITGHCTYFSLMQCEQWKSGCLQCCQLDCYPKCIRKGNVINNYIHKKEAFTNVTNMTLIVPSQWLAGLIRQSFLKEYPIQVKYNVIDTAVFKPTKSDFKKRNKLQKRKIILGVANVWDKRKGLNDFLKLSKLLDDSYIIVLVGLSKKQIKKMPFNVLGVKRTNSVRELAGIYTSADVFVNPTYEDNYPTVNLEAQACGTAVITYDTGGCRETLKNSSCKVVPVGDVPELLKAVYEILR